MTNEFLAVSDGIFTLLETEIENQFYFYRNDGKALTDIGDEPMNLYYEYIMKKIMHGEITNMPMNNISSEMSDDKKRIKLIMGDNCENPKNNSNVNGKRPNILKHLLHKFFG